MNLREMDRQIAEKVMGLPPELIHFEEGGKVIRYGGRDTRVTPCAHYTEDASDSRDLRAKLAGKWPIWQLTRKLSGLIVFEMWPIGGQWYHGEADTEELAVCLCACKAFGITLTPELEPTK